MKKIISTIKRFFSDLFTTPPYEISKEREEEIIKKIAYEISKFGMEIPAWLMLRPLFPTSTIISQVFIMPAAPLLDIIGVNGYEIAAFLEKKENVKLLLDEIERLKDAREKDR
jgi:hypothetical protein